MVSLERWPKVQALRAKLNGKAKAEPGCCAGQKAVSLAQ
jgi:hypothetical protein